MRLFTRHLKSLIFLMSLATAPAALAAGDMLTPDEVPHQGISANPSNESGLFLGAGASVGQGRSTESGSSPGLAYFGHVEPGYQFNRGDWGRLEASVDVSAGTAAFRTADDKLGKVTTTVPLEVMFKGGYGYSLGQHAVGLVEVGVGPALAKWKIEPNGKSLTSDTVTGLAYMIGYKVVVPMSSFLDATVGISWSQMQFDVSNFTGGGDTYAVGPEHAERRPSRRHRPPAPPLMQSTPPFKKLLVANRGEIAIRVFRSATRLGIRTVAVYSHEDRFAMHRLKADEAYQVGKPGEPIRSYLNIAAIVELAREKGVDAIHPGYGFLSENAEFARACAAAGIAFVGPRPELLDLLGDKVAARGIAREAGVPVLRQRRAGRCRAPRRSALAEALGYPVIVKASMGGGGRGMRVVETAGRARRRASTRPAARRGPPSACPTSSSRSSSATRQAHRGPAPRRPARQPRPPLRARLLDPAPAPEGHRDRPGLQPRPGAPPGASATRPSRSAGTSGYENAGTVEFLVDAETGEFYFIEVNPRIQVEHTVTEIVTGIDLVKSQILDRAGGAAVDPEIGMPARTRSSTRGCGDPVPAHDRGPGEQVHARLRPDHQYRSAGGLGIRLDGGTATTGGIITPYYDSLLVKVSASAPRPRGRGGEDGAEPQRVPDPRRPPQHPVPAERRRAPGVPRVEMTTSSSSGTPRSSVSRSPGTGRPRCSVTSQTSRSTTRTTCR